jgi:murein tripeptide amidase MpaA
LLSNHENAKKLRQNFIFKIIPMLNPDGVIHGNYRSNISGYDLNKKWENPSKIYHPEIYYLKKLILSI